MTAIEQTRPGDRPPDAVARDIDHLVSVISACAAAVAEDVRTVADRLPAWSSAVILDEVTEIEGAVAVIGRLSHRLVADELVADELIADDLVTRATGA